MKKLLFILLMPLLLQAQSTSIYIGLDAKNATVGSQATQYKASVDLIAGFKHVRPSNIEFGFGIEYFKQIGYSSWRYSIGYQREFNKVTISANLEPTFIRRVAYNTVYAIQMVDNVPIVNYNIPLQNKRVDGYLTIGLNGNISYFLTRSFGIGIQSNLLYRKDLEHMYTDDKYDKDNWMLSNYAVATYKFN